MLVQTATIVLVGTAVVIATHVNFLPTIVQMRLLPILKRVAQPCSNGLSPRTHIDAS